MADRGRHGHAVAARAFTSVHVLKIVQEALGNILRYTHATRVEVPLEPLHRQAGLLLEVRDNGHGITVPEGHATAATGHGLVGMRRRARRRGYAADPGPARGAGHVHSLGGDAAVSARAAPQGAPRAALSLASF